LKKTLYIINLIVKSITNVYTLERSWSCRGRGTGRRRRMGGESS
jgi:hypothetical protein